MRCPLRPDVHDARGRFLWQSAGFFRAQPAENGMAVMRAGCGVSCSMVAADCGMEFGKKGDRILPNSCQKSASGTIADCYCIYSGAGKTPPQIKLRAAFRAATACKTMKIVDSRQHERLKTHEYDL
jgi:hypothetical protein